MTYYIIVYIYIYTYTCNYIYINICLQQLRWPLVLPFFVLIWGEEPHPKIAEEFRWCLVIQPCVLHIVSKKSPAGWFWSWKPLISSCQWSKCRISSFWPGAVVSYWLLGTTWKALLLICTRRHDTFFCTLNLIVVGLSSFILGSALCQYVWCLHPICSISTGGWPGRSGFRSFKGRIQGI